MSDERRGLIERLLGRLRFPHLFLLVLALFGITMAVPDPLPFVDEVLLGAMTVLFGLWRRRREERLTEREERPALPPADER